MTEILILRNVTCGYDDHVLLQSVNFEIEPREIVHLEGENGSGKSTLLRVMYGILPPMNPDAVVLFRRTAGQPFGPPNPVSANLKRGFAYLSQHGGVFDELSVSENLDVSVAVSESPRACRNRIAEVLGFFPVLAHLARSRPKHMSGGERRQLALALMLIHRPAILLLDEPLSGLAPDVVRTVMSALSELRASYGMSVLLVEHRADCAARVATRSVRIDAGVLTGPGRMPTSRGMPV
jgi:ABC-type branched-subunit amino acid transport system ATPase component